MRVSLLLIVGVIAFLSQSIAGQAANAQTQEKKQPNILILYADDLGFGDLGCYNDASKIPTPNLDALAASGLRLTDGHSSSGICTPSRYALLTGRHHWRDFHGIVNAFGESVFKPERTTMPEMLQARGYHTAAIGKWHLGWNWAAIQNPEAKMVPSTDGKKKGWGADAFDWTKPIPDGPLDHGFDHYYGDSVINFPPYTWIENDRVLEAPVEMVDMTKFRQAKEGNWECRPGPMIKDWDPYLVLPKLADRGVNFIKKQKDADKPFFLYFAFPSPHAPIVPTDDFDGKSKAGPYGDFLVQTDDVCGRILNALEESGLAENTIVVFTSDNGPERYAYLRDKKFQHWSAEPLRGLKRDIYEGGHRVPFIIRWPGLTKKGTTCDALVSQIDLMATFAAMTSFDLPDDCAEDSHNLLPLLKGETQVVRTTHVHNTRKDHYALRQGDWLLVDGKNGYLSGRNKAWEARHDYRPDDEQQVELYNLSEDLGQRNNVAELHSERVTAMKSLLRKIREQGHTAPRLEKRTP